MEIDNAEFGKIFLARMHGGEANQQSVTWDLDTKVTKRIVRHSGADVLARVRIKDWISSVKDAIETGGGNIGAIRSFLDLAIAEAGVIAPGAVKEFVALEPDGGKEGIRFIVQDPITEFDQARSGSTGDDLLKRIEGIKSAKRDTRIIVGRTA